MFIIIEILLGLIVLFFIFRKIFGFGSSETRNVPEPVIPKVRKRGRKSVSFSDVCDKIVEERETEDEVEVDFDIEEKNEDEEETNCDVEEENETVLIDEALKKQLPVKDGEVLVVEPMKTEVKLDTFGQFKKVGDPLSDAPFKTRVKKEEKSMHSDSKPMKTEVKLEPILKTKKHEILAYVPKYAEIKSNKVDNVLLKTQVKQEPIKKTKKDDEILFEPFVRSKKYTSGFAKEPLKPQVVSPAVQTMKDDKVLIEEPSKTTVTPETIEYSKIDKNISSNITENKDKTLLELSNPLDLNLREEIPGETNNSFNKFIIGELNKKIKSFDHENAELDQLIDSNVEPDVEDQFLQLYNESFVLRKQVPANKIVQNVPTVNKDQNFMEQLKRNLEKSNKKQMKMKEDKPDTKRLEVKKKSAVKAKDEVKKSEMIDTKNDNVPVASKGPSAGYSNLIEQLKARQASRKPIDPDGSDEELPGNDKVDNFQHSNIENTLPIRESHETKIKEFSPPKAKESTPPTIKELSPPKDKEFSPLKEESTPHMIKDLSPPKSKEFSPPKAKESTPPTIKELSPSKDKEFSPPKEESTPHMIKDLSPPKSKEFSPPKEGSLPHMIKEISPPKLKETSPSKEVSFSHAIKELSPSKMPPPPKEKESAPPMIKDPSPPKTKEFSPLKESILHIIKELSPPKVSSPLKDNEATPSTIKELSIPQLKESTPPIIRERSPPKVNESTPPTIDELSLPQFEEFAHTVKEVSSPNFEEYSVPKEKESTPPMIKECSPPKVNESISPTIEELSLQFKDFPSKEKESLPPTIKENSPSRFKECSISKENESSPPMIKELSQPKDKECSPPKDVEPFPPKLKESSPPKEREPTPPTIREISPSREDASSLPNVEEPCSTNIEEFCSSEATDSTSSTIEEPSPSEIKESSPSIVEDLLLHSDKELSPPKTYILTKSLTRESFPPVIVDFTEFLNEISNEQDFDTQNVDRTEVANSNDGDTVRPTIEPINLSDSYQSNAENESAGGETDDGTLESGPAADVSEVELSQSMEDLLAALEEETLSQQVEENLLTGQVDPVSIAGDALISDRRNKLENSAQGWRKRVGQHDATLFSVAGRMGKDAPSLPSGLASSPLAPALVTTAQEKKTPQANRFRSRRADNEGMSPGLMKSMSSMAVSQPVSPKRPGPGDFKRSVSVSGVDDVIGGNVGGMSKSEGDQERVGPSVPVPRADDETFTSFYASASQAVVDSPSSHFIPYNNNNIEQIAEDIDLDAIDSGARQMLSVTGVNRVRATRRAGGSRNPLRALAARTDLRQEYTEPPATGVADKEAARLRKEKISVNSPMAVEALAGLAAREDFAAILLKKSASRSSPPLAELTDGPVLLVHVKGRRRVQVRLVEPVADSVNSGDCFVLVTPDHVFNYNGFYSNVIERSRASDIALHIHTTKDLGCANSTSVITLDEQLKHRSPKQWKQFWSLLGVVDNLDDFTPTPAGNADEDEIFESGIISTNMCYEVLDDELVPVQEYWGQTPKIAMLDPSKILVFDFGSELYVWNGKNTILENRRRAFQLAQELWDEGYDYKDCHICPLNIHQVLGARPQFKETSNKDSVRPPWAMITKVTQHMETILFKDKFLDWPDFTRVIRVKEEEDSFKGAAEIKPCNVEVMWNREYVDPSLVLEGSHVGRGNQHYDKETMRHFEVKTKSITKWMVQEYVYSKFGPEHLNEFYSGDSYIIRWEYQITVTGRELNGKPSKHNLTGRDRCAYFCWQGKDASANEKGAAALLTVELDHEKGPQVRVTQNCEPPAFLNLFKGSLVIHQGKKGSNESKHRLYTLRGNIESESHLVEVTCSMRQLRSRASMIIADIENNQIYVWHGVKSLKHTRSLALEAAKKMAAKNQLFEESADVKVTEVTEGEEPKSVIDILGGPNRELYHSLVSKQNKTEEEEEAVTPRLFHFTDLSGQFDAIEVLSPLRHETLVTAYPFSQQELYSASQPGLYLLDCGDRLWLWQGWWPQQEDFESIETGSGTQRWQACRRAAMETVLAYWRHSRPSGSSPRAFLAVAGLEPLPFTNMFDDWRDRDDIAEINIASGHKVGEGEVSVSVELCRLSQSSFPLAVLRQRPLPEAVDPAHIERYLTPEDFQETFNMSKEEFSELPAWKQANIKKDLGLF